MGYRQPFYSTSQPAHTRKRPICRACRRGQQCNWLNKIGLVQKNDTEKKTSGKGIKRSQDYNEMLLASRFAEINWDHIAKCTLSETSEYCSGLCDSHPQALWRYPGALQIQRNPLQALEYSQAVKTQGSKPGRFTRLLISLSVLLAFFRVWRLRPDQEVLSPARSILYQHLVVSLNSTERKGGSKAAPSNEVHQESVLYMN